MIESVEKKISELVESVGYERAAILFGTLKGGKRLRAKLIKMIAQTHKDADLLAAVIELIHAASLLHDDVIDEAQTRRGVASVNATEGSKTAVMLGDILYSKAFSELVALDRSIAKAVADSVTRLSAGEMMDVEMAKAFNSDEALYMEMLYLKTATLIETAAFSAAVLSGKDAEAYARYGKNLGLSFQVIDDILDIVSDEATLGKPALNDFVEGKCTLPYIYLYQALDTGDRTRLLRCHGVELEAADSAWIMDSLHVHGCIEKAYAYARRLSDEAIAAVDDPQLHAVIETMMQRKY